MKKVLFCVVLAASTLTGCSIYHPQAVSIPLVNHPGDAQVDVSLGMSAWVIPDVVTVNATGSYGFNDWLAGQAHINYGFENAYGHLAAGAYKRLGTHSVAEGYVGFGYGGAWRDRSDAESYNDMDEGTTSYEYSGHFMLPFVQGNIGLRDLTAAHIDLAFGLKVGAYIPDFDYKAYDASGNLRPELSKQYSSTNLLLEPQLQLRIGGEHVKFNTRLGLAGLNDVYADGTELTFDWLTMSAGLTFFF